MISKALGFLATSLIALASPAAATSLFQRSNATTATTGFPPCDALISAGLSHLLLTPTDTAYEPRIQSYYALNTRRHPYCIVQPHTTAEVSTIASNLLGPGSSDGAGDWHVAIRAGGHNLGDTNNIENGVVIDLKYLNQSTYDSRTNTASLGPGAKWQNVYKKLHKYGVLAPGGRDGDVGVGGFLLGGGSTYYMGKQGFGCDLVKNYEVVLANGTVVHASNNSNTDIWRALKGGGSNFGIVTRFDMEALPDTKIARGQRTISANYTGQFVDAVVGFTDQQRKYDTDALVAILMHVEGQDVLETIEVNTEGVENSTGFNNLSRIPQLAPPEQSVQYLYEAAFDSRLTGNAWAVQATLTFKNNKSMLNHAAATHRTFAKSLEQAIGKDTFQSFVFFQPLPSFFADISAKRGGNMFADTLRDDNAVLWTGGVFVNTNQSDYMIASAMMHEMVAELEGYSKQIGAHNDLRYMNYADFSQDPLGSYGMDKVNFMKTVARKYDPEGKFQRMVPGGFKISRVEG